MKHFPLIGNIIIIRRKKKVVPKRNQRASAVIHRMSIAKDEYKESEQMVKHKLKTTVLFRNAVSEVALIERVIPVKTEFVLYAYDFVTRVIICNISLY